jgi:hypothetical protein
MFLLFFSNFNIELRQFVFEIWKKEKNDKAIRIFFDSPSKLVCLHITLLKFFFKFTNSLLCIFIKRFGKSWQSSLRWPLLTVFTRLYCLIKKNNKKACLKKLKLLIYEFLKKYVDFASSNIISYNSCLLNIFQVKRRSFHSNLLKKTKLWEKGAELFSKFLFLIKLKLQATDWLKVK